jgi:uncharacterized protein (DUF952 family)
MRPMEPAIYHLALAADWQAVAGGGGEYTTSTLGVSLTDQGFIHCSFADQVQQIADLLYAGRSDVVLLTIDPARVSAPILLEQVGPDTFPHVYGALEATAVTAVRLLAVGPGGRLDAAPAPIA